MATPILEQIAVIVRSRLAAISTGSGYETTAAEAIRPTRISDRSPKDYQLIIKQGDKTPNDALSCPGNPAAVAWDQPFVIAGILRPSETSATAIDTFKNTFEADVIKSLTAPASWWNFGGLAMNSVISGVADYESSEGTEGGFMVTLTVTYRVSENDPYTARN